ncbi:site-specific integrase [Pseudobacillus sp. FSL P4-0506]|uniref:tyrosine-type recombinase/integrase n=1 Tax=Pseudobacillus sp. FSL P4-0506 TaxID=2921576 RepID=UPI0030F76CB8
MASIQKRGNNSFLLVVEAGYDGNGKRKKRTKTVRVEDSLLKTKKKLNDFLQAELYKFKTEVESGEYIAPEKMKFDEFTKEWEKKYAKNELSPGTLEAHRQALNNHILPQLKNKRLDEIKPIHVVNLLDSLTRKDGKNIPLSSGTKQYVYRVLRNILERATEWKLIKENPVASVKRPKNTGDLKEINVYSEKEVEQLFKAVQEKPFHWRVFTTLALAAGLRRGELLGLEWKHVDFEKGVLSIRQAIVRGENGEPLLKKTKTKKSMRMVTLPPSVLEELKTFQRYWKKERMRLYDRLEEKEHEFIFCNENGQHFYPTTPTTWWRRLLKTADVRYIRLHDLRHTSATLLINQGVHAKIISERLGHADIRVTMDTYGHALQSADQEAAQKLDGLFSGKKNKVN